MLSYSISNSYDRHMPFTVSYMYRDVIGLWDCWNATKLMFLQLHNCGNYNLFPFLVINAIKDAIILVFQVLVKVLVSHKQCRKMRQTINKFYMVWKQCLSMHFVAFSHLFPAILSIKFGTKIVVWKYFVCTLIWC